ncbi:MAG: ABC transporter ATP-binding protein [Acidimicrobiia bacterium]
MESGPFAVLCEDVTVKYGDLVAVDSVSFDVREGEVFGLLGPNGAGKTSVIRALTTIIDPASGRVQVAGSDLTDPSVLRSRIGVLPESNGYPGFETAFEYLRFYGRLFGLPNAKAVDRAKGLLDRFGLGGSSNRLIGTFSRGMRQRLGIARALVNDPRVLFLDEPTLGLDPAGRQDILGHLTGTIRDGGTSVVLCSHLLDDVERVCDRIAILDRGRIVADGTVAEVIAAAGVGGTVQISVSTTDSLRSVAILRDLDGVRHAREVEVRPGVIDVELVESEPHANQLLGVLLDAGVEVRGVALEGAHLSEAFLELTDAI